MILYSKDKDEKNIRKEKIENEKNTIILMIDSLKAYDQIRVLTQGGPSGSTRTILYMYYQTAFENFNTGQATAIATLLLIIVAILAILQFGASKKWVHY